ncbi:hypothetical protein KCP71_10760 [Salmonella enterica subsp. enterica]|nr:hypothetical protein KCP71_10760 [Salmonella enterica subsp. enterica]
MVNNFPPESGRFPATYGYARHTVLPNQTSAGKGADSHNAYLTFDAGFICGRAAAHTRCCPPGKPARNKAVAYCCFTPVMQSGKADDADVAYIALREYAYKRQLRRLNWNAALSVFIFAKPF